METPKFSSAMFAEVLVSSHVPLVSRRVQGTFCHAGCGSRGLALEPAAVTTAHWWKGFCADGHFLIVADSWARQRGQGSEPSSYKLQLLNYVGTFLILKETVTLLVGQLQCGFGMSFLKVQHRVCFFSLSNNSISHLKSFTKSLSA